MQYSTMKKSLEIFEKHLDLDDEFFEADHDIIYGPDLETPFTDAEKKELEDLNWFEDDGYWSHHC